MNRHTFDFPILPPKRAETRTLASVRHGGPGAAGAGEGVFLRDCFTRGVVPCCAAVEAGLARLAEQPPCKW